MSINRTFLLVFCLLGLAASIGKAGWLFGAGYFFDEVAGLLLTKGALLAAVVFSFMLADTLRPSPRSLWEMPDRASDG